MYLQQEFRGITLRQLELMAHTIGFNRTSIKYNKYEAYRNYFTTSGSGKKELDELVDKGFMAKIEMWDGEKARGYCYSVTHKGLKVFSNLYDCKVSIGR